MGSAAPVLPHKDMPAGDGGHRDGHEIEIKFTADQAVLDDLKSSHATADAEVQKLVSIYFDTPADDLRRSGHTLRIRRKGNGAPNMSIKSSALPGSGPFHRREIEVPAPGGLPDFGLFSPKIRSLLSAVVGAGPLVKRFEVRVERTAISLPHLSSRIEMAFDTGKIIAGSRSAPVSEIELELKSGSVRDLLDLASRLAAQAPLQLDFVSKSERGFRLALGLEPTPMKASPFAIPHKATTGEAMAAVVAGSLAHFVGNWDALRRTRDAEAIHQMRVALRRMRSALGMFRRAVPKQGTAPALEELSATAKSIATVLGHARELDVFLDMTKKGPLQSADCPAGDEALLVAVRAQQVSAYDEARRMIDGGDAMRFVFAVQAFIADLPNAAVTACADSGHLQEPAVAFAAKALSRLNDRALKRGAGLPALGDDARHELRIALKNLRYGAEFFEGIFDRPKKAKAFEKTISRLQDLLGAHNDVVMARRMLDGVESSSGQRGAGTAGFALGWLARGVSLADDELKHAWRNFKRAPRYWE